MFHKAFQPGLPARIRLHKQAGKPQANPHPSKASYVPAKLHSPQAAFCNAQPSTSFHHYHEVRNCVRCRNMSNHHQADMSRASYSPKALFYCSAPNMMFRPYVPYGQEAYGARPLMFLTPMCCQENFLLLLYYNLYRASRMR